MPPPEKPRATLDSGSPSFTGLKGNTSLASVSTMCTEASSRSPKSSSAATAPSPASAIFVRPSGMVAPMEQEQSMRSESATAALRSSWRTSSDTGNSGSTGDLR